MPVHNDNSLTHDENSQWSGHFNFVRTYMYIELFLNLYSVLSNLNSRTFGQIIVLIVKMHCSARTCYLLFLGNTYLCVYSLT